MERFDPIEFRRLTAEGIEAAQQGDFDRAVAAMRRAVAKTMFLPDTDPFRLQVHVNAGAVHVRARRWEEARALYADALRLASIAGARPLELGDIHVNLGGIALELGDEAAAAHHHRLALDFWTRALPPDHPNLVLLRKKLAAPRAHTTKDGIITVVPPTDDGWQLEEQAAHGATLVKVRRADRSQFFFMMAKHYTVPREQIFPARVLAEQVYKKTYDTNFSDVRYESSAPFGPDGHETLITMRHASMGPITKRERVVVRAEHVFLLSAEGKPDVFARMHADIDAWFARTRFQSSG